MNVRKYFSTLAEPVRIATHASDLDGIGSAALLIRACNKSDKKYEILFLSVDEAKQSTEKVDFVTDLPKINGAINIDHHISNLEELKQQGRLTKLDIVKQEVSAARLVYQFLEDFTANDMISKEIEEISSLADQGKIPKAFREIDLLIKFHVDNPKKLLKITEKFSELGYNLCDDIWIQKEFAKINQIILDTRHKFKDFFNNIKKQAPKIILVDVVNVINQKFAKEAISFAYDIGVEVLGILSYKAEPDVFSVSFRVEKAVQDRIDISKVAKKLGGGGHPMAAGASGKDRKIFREKIEEELQKIAEEQDKSMKTYILENYLEI